MMTLILIPLGLTLLGALPARSKHPGDERHGNHRSVEQWAHHRAI